MDGRYTADGRQVRRNHTKTGNGITMGFIICELHEHVGDDAAQEIAEALNLHMDKYPEKH